MDVSALSSVAQSPAPLPQADLRPTADAAALARDSTPQIPLPPSFSQQGVVSAGMLRDLGAVDSSRRVEDVARTLKPFGVSMLPSDAAREATREAARAQQWATEAQAKADRADDQAAAADRAQVAAEAADASAAASAEEAAAVPAPAPQPRAGADSDAA